MNEFKVEIPYYLIYHKFLNVIFVKNEYEIFACIVLGEDVKEEDIDEQGEILSLIYGKDNVRYNRYNVEREI